MPKRSQFHAVATQKQELTSLTRVVIEQDLKKLVLMKVVQVPQRKELSPGLHCNLEEALQLK